MANTKSAGKRARQTLRRAVHNRSVKTHLRKLQKQIRSAPERSADQIRAAISAIDKAAKRGVIHRNAANRRKARLNKSASGEIGELHPERTEAESKDPAKTHFESCHGIESWPRGLCPLRCSLDWLGMTNSKCSLHILVAG